MKGLFNSHHKQHIFSVMPGGYITMQIISSAEVFVVAVVVVDVVSLRLPLPSHYGGGVGKCACAAQSK